MKDISGEHFSLLNALRANRHIPQCHYVVGGLRGYEAPYLGSETPGPRGSWAPGLRGSGAPGLWGYQGTSLQTYEAREL